MGTEVIAEFYSPFPVYGVRFDRQIPAWRDNTVAINPISKASFLNANDPDRNQDALAFVASGYVANRFKYRTGYDKDRDVYAIQFNAGNDIIQDWQDVLSIDTSGKVTALFNNFYASIIVQETNGSNPFLTDKILFNSESFYITGNSEGKPVINFRGSSGGGTVTDAENIGSGYELFAGKSGTILQFKTIDPGENISMLDDGTSITISAEDPTDGENLGTGTGIFAQKIGDNLQFKSLKPGKNIALSSTADEVTITGLDTSFYLLAVGLDNSSRPYKNIQVLKFEAARFYLNQNGLNTDEIGVGFRPDSQANIGSGVGIFAGKVGLQQQYKSLVAGPNISLTDAANQITVAADFPGRFYLNIGLDNTTKTYREINTLRFSNKYFYLSQNTPNTDEVNIAFREDAISNLGTGSGIFAQKVNREFQLKSLTQGAGVKLTSTATAITVESTIEQFYGLTVKQSNNVAKFRNISLISFESARFYLDQNSPNSDEVNVNFRPDSQVNLGTGTGIFAGRAGLQSQFKSLVAAGGIKLTNDANTITIENTRDQFYLNVGQTVGKVYKDVSTIKFNSNDFYIEQNTPNTDTVIVNSRGGSSGTTTASNLDAGSGIFAQKIVNDLQFKSLVQGAGIKLTSTATNITIENTRDQFYLSVKQSDNKKSFKNLNVINFLTDDFYIKQRVPNTDEVTVNLRGIADFSIGTNKLALQAAGNVTSGSIGSSTALTTSFVTYASLTHTPKRTNSKIQIRASCAQSFVAGTTSFRILRNGTDITGSNTNNLSFILLTSGDTATGTAGLLYEFQLKNTTPASTIDSAQLSVVEIA